MKKKICEGFSHAVENIAKNYFNTVSCLCDNEKFWSKCPNRWFKRASCKQLGEWWLFLAGVPAETGMVIFIFATWADTRFDILVIERYQHYNFRIKRFFSALLINVIIVITSTWTILIFDKLFLKVQNMSRDENRT